MEAASLRIQGPLGLVSRSQNLPPQLLMYQIQVPEPRQQVPEPAPSPPDAFQTNMPQPPEAGGLGSTSCCINHATLSAQIAASDLTARIRPPIRAFYSFLGPYIHSCVARPSEPAPNTPQSPSLYLRTSPQPARRARRSPGPRLRQALDLLAPTRAPCREACAARLCGPVCAALCGAAWTPPCSRRRDTQATRHSGAPEPGHIAA